MTDKEFNQKYPLWQCEERCAHKYEINRNGAFLIYAVWGNCSEYMFHMRNGASEEDAQNMVQVLNQHSKNWRPKFNSIGALIN